MPLYSMHRVNPGVVPVKDQNAPTPQVAPETEEPDFLEQRIDQLAAVRKELSGLWAKYVGNRMNCNPYDPDQPTPLEAQIEYERQRERLERQEGELVAEINSFAYVASLSVNDHDVDDEALTPAERSMPTRAGMMPMAPRMMDGGY